jgi:hypothetical protein
VLDYIALRFHIVWKTIVKRASSSSVSSTTSSNTFGKGKSYAPYKYLKPEVLQTTILKFPNTLLRIKLKPNIVQTMLPDQPAIELSSRDEGGKSYAKDITATPADGSPALALTPPIFRRKMKLFSAGFSFFVAGTNDGSMGALLPYMLQDYNIGTSLIALMYSSPQPDQQKSKVAT